jgi:hypothetical protein
MRALVLAGFCALLAGCPSDLEKQFHVGKLRVLAVRADPPELILRSGAPLPSTTLTALAVEPADASISMRFALCEFIGDAPPGTLSCPGDAGLDLPESGPLSARLDLSDPRILAFAAAYDGGVAADAGAALAAGVPLLVGFTASVAAQQLGGFATITLRTPERGPAFPNPEITGLRFTPGDLRAGKTVRLEPLTAPKDDPSLHYGFSFFATAGSMSSLRSTDTTATGQPAPTWVDWTAPDNAQEVRIWVVLRDGRGGTGWLERTVQVQ